MFFLRLDFGLHLIGDLMSILSHPVFDPLELLLILRFEDVADLYAIVLVEVIDEGVLEAYYATIVLANLEHVFDLL